MGSRSHDFEAELLSKTMISMTAAGARKLRPGADVSLMAGGSAAPVDDRIFSTMSGGFTTRSERIWSATNASTSKDRHGSSESEGTRRCIGDELLGAHDVDDDERVVEQFFMSGLTGKM
jgi:hypothetical protein